MNTALISSDVAELLSRITGQKLQTEDITPPVRFLVALLTVLTGVMLADKVLTDSEKQRWQKTVKQFIPPEKSAVALVQAISKGIREQKVYLKSEEILTLTSSFSESERLLLIGLGYEMATADGQMDTIEKRYLQLVANRLNLKPKHLGVFEASFSNQTPDPTSLDEVRLLLDPGRFHDLDIVFVNAASNLLAALPSDQNQQEIPLIEHTASSYKKLSEFKAHLNQLNEFCHQLGQLTQAGVEHGFLISDIGEEISKISQRLESQRFRLAVVGEFSQGKSTLLNALLGEQIQPTRAIPCSGAISVLRYGERKRVICCYKDGRQEEISVEEYKNRSAIPKEVAQEQRHTEELAHSDLDEIIFEHPELELCSSGVEIVDSPGLNEHPERTAITQRLLEKTDAAIFLTNAMRLLPEKEKELIQEVRTQLNGTKDKEPAENLFVLVNFMDMVEEEEDRQDIVQRLTGFVKNENLLSSYNDRIHYISAKAALRAILTETNDEHLRKFRSFTQALERFLTIERGSLQIKQAVKAIDRVIQSNLESFSQAEATLDGEITISEADKQKILNQMGEVSGRELKVRRLANQIQDKVQQEVKISLSQWREKLYGRMSPKKNNRWDSKHSPVWSQKQLIQDYSDCFTRDLLEEVNIWKSEEFEKILKCSIQELDDCIRVEIEAIQAEFKALDLRVKTDLSHQLNLAITGISDDFTGLGGFLGGIGAGGILAAALLLFTPVGLIAAAAAGIAGLVAGIFGFGMLDVDNLRGQIKDKVFEAGFKNLDTSLPKLHQKVDETIASIFERRVELVSQVVSRAISLYENLLEQQEKAHAATLEQRQQERDWINTNRNELKQIAQGVETVLERSVKI